MDEDMSLDIQRTLGRLEAKIDELLKSRDISDARTTKLEERVAGLEAWKWRLLGGASVLGALGAATMKKLLEVLNG